MYKRQRLERICDDNGDEIVRYGHTAGGKLKEIRHGNGMHTAYEYDTDDNIIRLTLKNEKGIVFSDFRYEYDLKMCIRDRPLCLALSTNTW